MSFKVNQRKLWLRAVLMLFVFAAYLFRREQLQNIASYKILWNISPLHILWALLMLEMLLVPIPAFNRFVGCGKHFKRHYIPNPASRRSEAFYTYTFRMNEATVVVLAVWVAVILVIGACFYAGLLGPMEIVLITVFLYLCDQICVNIWCPFQSFIIGNKCCNTCRIYNWGHFMLFSPLIYLNTFYSISLLGVSFLILLQWEYLHHKYPERFSEITNLALRCSHCTGTICRIKRQLKSSTKSSHPSNL